MKQLVSSCLLFLISIASFAGPSINEKHQVYTIDGTTAEQLRTQMLEHGLIDHGRRVDAMTHWYIKWHYTWHYDNPTENPCYVTHAQVRADISYAIPEWANIQESAPALQTHWKNYINNLITHEEGHVGNAKQAASEIEQALLNTQAASSCQTLKEELDNAANTILQRHKNWDIQYDAETDHGRTQGAVFP